MSLQYSGDLKKHFFLLWGKNSKFIPHVRIQIICSFRRSARNQLCHVAAQEAAYFRQRFQIDFRNSPLDLDQKTGLYGSTAFYNRLRQSVEAASALNEKLALAILDIDNFKLVNDTYGHSKGDIVINRLAELMNGRCGDQHFPARFGGEEFAVIFSQSGKTAFDMSANEKNVCGKKNCKRTAAGEIAVDERVFCKTVLETVEAIREAFSQQNYDFTDKAVTLSVGIAFFQKDWTAEMLFDFADRAMYNAKAAGKNRVEMF